MAVTFDRARDAGCIHAILLVFDGCFPRTISSRVGDLAQHARKLAEHGTVEVAMRDGEAAGFVAFYANDATAAVAFLTHLAVAAPFRGAGIGAQLMQRCIQAAKHAGMTSMKLEVDTANAAAISFYRSLGFSPAGPASPASCFMVRAVL